MDILTGLYLIIRVTTVRGFETPSPQEKSTAIWSQVWEWAEQDEDLGLVIRKQREIGKGNLHGWQKKQQKMLV